MMLLPLIGCGDNGRPVGRLAGTVSYDEQPIAEGTIFATNHDGSITVETTILDGKYAIEACPLGEVRLVVVPPGPGRIVTVPERPERFASSRVEGNIASAKIKPVGIKTTLTPRQKEQRRRYRDFPSDYRQFDKTPLRTTVRSGDNEFDLVLKSKP